MRITSKVALRGKHHRERVEKMAQAAPPGMRVVPQEKYRAVLKHPKAGGFPADGGGKEWPNDRFTKRRIADGSVTLETDAMRENHKASRAKKENASGSEPAHHKPPPKHEPKDKDNNAA